MPFLLVEILNFQGSAHLRGVGSLRIYTVKLDGSEASVKASGRSKRKQYGGACEPCTFGPDELPTDGLERKGGCQDGAAEGILSERRRYA